MIGVICPSEFEYKALNLKSFPAEKVSVVKSGMGKLRSLYACAALKEKHPGLRAILLIGFAGGLTPNLAVGDVIEPHVFIEQDYNAEPFEKFPNLIHKPNAKKLLKTSSEALMLTQDRFLKENPYKNSAYAKTYKKIACDMESYAVAHFCKEARLEWHVVKLISDSADETADHDFLKACIRLKPRLNEIVSESIARLGA